jgi:hypothetical protein
MTPSSVRLPLSTKHGLTNTSAADKEVAEELASPRGLLYRVRPVVNQ